MDSLLNYEEETLLLDNDTLYVEDLTDTQHLYLIQGPAEYDLANLDGKDIVLHGTQDLISGSKKEDADKLHIESVSDMSNAASQMVVILPSRNDDKLHLSKAIAGSLVVSQRIYIPPIKYPEKDVIEETKKDFVKHKWKAFGSQSPCHLTETETPNRKRKHEDRKLSTAEDITDIELLAVTPEVLPEGSAEKKHKKKKKNKDKIRE